MRWSSWVLLALAVLSNVLVFGLGAMIFAMTLFYISIERWIEYDDKPFAITMASLLTGIFILYVVARRLQWLFLGPICSALVPWTFPAFFAFVDSTVLNSSLLPSWVFATDSETNQQIPGINHHKPWLDRTVEHLLSLASHYSRELYGQQTSLETLGRIMLKFRDQMAQHSTQLFAHTTRMDTQDQRIAALETLSSTDPKQATYNTQQPVQETNSPTFSTPLRRTQSLPALSTDQDAQTTASRAVVPQAMQGGSADDLGQQVVKTPQRQRQPTPPAIQDMDIEPSFVLSSNACQLDHIASSGWSIIPEPIQTRDHQYLANATQALQLHGCDPAQESQGRHGSLDSNLLQLSLEREQELQRRLEGSDIDNGRLRKAQKDEAAWIRLRVAEFWQLREEHGAAVDP